MRQPPARLLSREMRWAQLPGDSLMGFFIPGMPLTVAAGGSTPSSAIAIEASWPHVLPLFVFFFFLIFHYLLISCHPVTVEMHVVFIYGTKILDGARIRSAVLPHHYDDKYFMRN